MALNETICECEKGIVIKCESPGDIKYWNYWSSEICKTCQKLPEEAEKKLRKNGSIER